MRELWIEGTGSREIALMEDGCLCEYLRDEALPREAEAVLLGRVERIVPGMQAAFLNIGQEKNGFLPLEEHSEGCTLQKLQCGMAVPVQIKREAQGTKGAFLTRDITLAGEYMIFMPCNRHIGVSAKVTDREDRARLRRLGEEMTRGEAGVVLRTAAAQADPESVREELARLRDRWQEAMRAAPTAHVPSVLHSPRRELDRLLDDYAARGIDLIRTDDPALAARLGDRFPVQVAEAGFLSGGKWPHERDKALGRLVWLKSGGNLIFDQCEAMTVIDVNTAKYTGKRSLEATALQTNLEAAAEIARQLRLRNMAGIILIDMIDMPTEEQRQQVLAALEDACREDRMKTVVHGFTSLGLIEMTRRRSRRSLAQEWSVPCPHCHGAGRLPIHPEAQEAEHD